MNASRRHQRIRCICESTVTCRQTWAAAAEGNYILNNRRTRGLLLFIWSQAGLVDVLQKKKIILTLQRGDTWLVLSWSWSQENTNFHLTLQLADDKGWLVSTPFLFTSILYFVVELSLHLFLIGSTSVLMPAEWLHTLHWSTSTWESIKKYRQLFFPPDFILISLQLCCHGAKTKWAKRSGHGRLTLSCKLSVD